MNIGGAGNAPQDGEERPAHASPGPPRLTSVPGGATGPSAPPPQGPPRLTPVPAGSATSPPPGPPRLNAVPLGPANPAASETPLGPAWLANITGAPVRSAPDRSAPHAPPRPVPQAPQRSVPERPGAAIAPLPPASVEPVPAAPTPPRPAPPAKLAVVRGAVSQLANVIFRKLEERRAAIGSNAARVSRSLMIASGLMLALFLIALVLIPVEYRAPIEVEIPPPTRTIVLEPLPEPPAVTETPRAVAPEPVMVPDVLPVRSNEKLAQAPPLMRRRPVDPDAGQAGRERARKATAELAGATAALDRALGDLSTSLGAASGEVVPTRRARRRDVRSGRSDGELAGLEAGLKGSANADVGGSAVEGKLVALGTLGTSSAPVSEEGGGSSGAAPGVYRSNASLLAVIQKYAPGIQYCYENELKRDPGRRGKLVVSMTVAANGSVAQVSVVQNTLGSERLAQCALSQIRDWKFPAIAGGLTTFQAPFLFTPPE